MNLRHRIKKAKNELVELQELPKPSTYYEMAMHYQKEIKLNNLINLKKKQNNFYRFNETPMVDRGKITHISIWANFEQLAILQSVSGRVLPIEEIRAFDHIIREKIYAYAKKVSISEPRKLNGQPFRNEYAIALSSDKQKGKKLELIKIYWQHDGTDLMYPYELE